MTRVCNKCGKNYEHNRVDDDYRCVECRREYMQNYDKKRYAFKDNPRWQQLAQIPLDTIADSYLAQHPIKEVEVLWRYLHLKYGV